MDRTHQPLKVYASTGLARVSHCNGCSSQTTIVLTRGARTGTNDLASKIIKKIPVKSNLAFVRCGGNFDSFSSFKPRPMEPSARVPDNPAVGGRPSRDSRRLCVFEYGSLQWKVLHALMSSNNTQASRGVYRFA